MHTRLLALVLAAASAACASYDAPPSAKLVGTTDGLLPDPTQPLILQFSEPVDPSTVKVEVAPFVTDAEGNLGDEDSDPTTELSPTFKHLPGLEDFGSSQWIDDRTLQIVPGLTPPVGQSLVVVIEPGLADKEGNVTEVRQKIVFGYEFRCSGTVGSKIFEPGIYFFLVDVEKPIATQIQLFGRIGVDADSGRFLGTFTNADRNRDPNRCPTPCESSEACQLIPSPKCVIPSERAGTVDEFPDWVANQEPPVGYSFLVAGCVEDQNDTEVAFVNAPVDVVVQAPPVTVKQISLGSSFSLDGAGVLRGNGTMKSIDVLLGQSSSGPGLGSLTARRIPDGEGPPDLPEPPPIGEQEELDAGPPP